MAYKVAIDNSNNNYSNNGINEKDYSLSISKFINNRLNSLGIENFLVGDGNESERVNIIKNKYGNGNNIIVISNRLNAGNSTGTEIIYPLRSNSKLASMIADNINDIGGNVTKYYQQRDNTNTAYDEDYMIKNTSDNQTIVINYGYIDNNNDASFLKNNIEKLGEAVVKALANYIGVTYVPYNLDGLYIVKKNDSLWAIASKNNTTVNELKKLNNLSSNTLQIGQILKLPTKNESTNEITYTVKKGDSLWAIANKYDTTVDIIKNKNKLTSNLLSIGQILIIPSSSNYNNYVVQKGDTLYSIARKYNITVDAIKKLNNLSSNTLSINQVLIIPS